MRFLRMQPRARLRKPVRLLHAVSGMLRASTKRIAAMRSSCTVRPGSRESSTTLNVSGASRRAKPHSRTGLSKSTYSAAVLGTGASSGTISKVLARPVISNTRAIHGFTSISRTSGFWHRRAMRFLNSMRHVRAVESRNFTLLQSIMAAGAL